MKELPKEKIEWDKKKIILFTVVSLFLLIGLFKFKAIALDKNVSKADKSQISKNKEVKAVSSDNSGIVGFKKSVQDEVSNLKTEAQNINIIDIASSSPQVQKVINDLKALQNFPGNQIRQTCEKICSGL